MVMAAVSSRTMLNSILQWLILSLTFIVVVLFAGSVISQVPFERTIFQVIFFPLCAFAYLVLTRDPRYRLLAFFMLVYYALFGLLDLVLMFTASQYQIYEMALKIPKTQLADFIILLGGGVLLGMYCLTVSVWRKNATLASVTVWKYGPSLLIGAISWMIGIWCYFIVQFVYGIKGPAHVGLVSLVISNLYYLALLGDVIMVVTALKHPGRRAPWIFIAIMIGVEYSLGFAGNIKEVSYRLLALILIAQYFAKGKVNLKLILLIVVSFVPYQALFNVYREQIIQVRNTSVIEAASSARKSTDTVLAKFAKERDSMMKSTFIMLDRIDSRKYVQIITQKTGVTVPFQDGYTFKLLPYAFIPGMLWPEKPQISTGILMNQTFKLSASKLTFVPSTMLGEFYWNFGVMGVIAGMTFLGTLFATINCLCLKDANFSTVGMLTVLVATYFLVARFEASVASQLSQFIRVTVILFAVNAIMGLAGGRQLRTADSKAETQARTPRYANIMRDHQLQADVSSSR